MILFYFRDKLIMYYSMPTLASKFYCNIVLLYGYCFRSLGNFAFHIQIERKIKMEIPNNNLVMEEHKM